MSSALKVLKQSRVIAYLVAVLIILTAVSTTYYLYSQQNHERMLAYINNPKQHDIYIIDTEVLSQTDGFREKYLIAQIDYLGEEEVSFKQSNYVFLRVHDAIKSIRSDKLLTHNFFAYTPLQLSTSQLEQLWQEGGIKEIGRSPNGMHLYGGIVIGKRIVSLDSRPTSRPGSEENQLAIIYYQGDYGYRIDYQKAFELFKSAAEKGHPYAQFNLAQMYRDGEGTDKDIDRALHWLGQARTQNVELANDEYLRLCERHDKCSAGGVFETR